MLGIAWQIIDFEMTFGGSPPLWRMILALLIIIMAVLLAQNISKYLPIYLKKIISKLDKSSKEKYGDRREKKQRRELSSLLRVVDIEVKRFAWWGILLIYGFIAITTLGYDIYTEFMIMNYPFSIWMIIQFFIILIIFVLFIKTILSPITKLILQALFGRAVTKWTIAKEHEKLETSMNALVILIGIYVGMLVVFPDYTELPYYWLTYKLIGVAAIMIGVIFATRLLLFVFRVKYLIPRKMDIHAANALENIFLILSILIMIGLVLSFFNIDIILILGSLTFIGFAIAFGMQDSIANIMAGFMLAGDKPFVIGDRVRVGELGRETWGDVVKIGLNTTRIKTVENELVVVPNHLIANNEIWNYTRDSPVLMHKIDIGISYGSDWRLAKKIILEEARAHPRVLKTPQPFVRIDNFGDSSMKLKLSVWLKHALDRDQVRSDLFESIKDGFDSEGVEIPFPYRTIVKKEDIPKEKRLDDPSGFENVRRYPSHGRDYFEYGDWHGTGTDKKIQAADDSVKILVTSSNLMTSENIAKYSMDFAKQVDGKIVAFYVMREYSRPREEEGLKILSVFEKMGKKENVLVATIMDIGDVVERVIRYVKENNIDFIIIGRSPKASVLLWGKENIEREIKKLSNVPVITVED